MTEFLLAISSNSREIYNYAEKIESENSTSEIILWVITLVLIISLCLFYSLGWPKVKQNLKLRKEKKAEVKESESQKEELERLHKIKEKNKRK